MSVDSVRYQAPATSISELKALLDLQRQAYAAHPFPPLAQRQQWL